MDEGQPQRTRELTEPGRAVVVTGGDPLPSALRGIVDRACFVVAADSGVDRLWELGRRPDLVVGDLDSVSPEGLDRVRRAGLRIEQHPTDKDATDTELALDAAARRGYRSITVLSGGGDRLDHMLGWLHVLADRRWAHRLQLDAWCATTHVRVLHGEREHHWHEPERGAVVSLLPLAGPCHGVTTKGLRWPLDDATLSPTSSRGLSNAVIERQVSVGLRSGVLAVMRPQRISANDDTLTPHPDGGTP